MNTYMLAEAHQNRLLQEGADSRTGQFMGGQFSSLRDKILLNIGQSLIDAGEAIKRNVCQPVDIRACPSFEN